MNLEKKLKSLGKIESESQYYITAKDALWERERITLKVNILRNGTHTGVITFNLNPSEYSNFKNLEGVYSGTKDKTRVLIKLYPTDILLIEYDNYLDVFTSFEDRFRNK